MASSASSTGHCCLLIALVLLSSSNVYGQLSTTFYASSCPALLSIVSNAVAQAIAADQRMGASLVRLFFHDCFVQGCDASILLVDKPGFVGEQTAFPNNNSVRGYDVINSIKATVEASCPGVVSCADIVALAAQDSTFQLGGPSWSVPLGRRDATTASWSLANSDLPSPASSLSTLITKFGSKGLSARDMTALSGAHTIGFAQCQNFRAHIYNDTNIDPTFAAGLRAGCPAASGSSADSSLAPLDAQTQLVFDNAYYADLVAKRVLLHSDQELYNNGSQDSLVKQYSSNSARFFTDFVAAMIKMGNAPGTLTGTAGQIRANCSVVN